MLSKFNVGVRFLGCGLLLGLTISIVDSLLTGTVDCRSCAFPMQMLDQMEFHGLTISVYECTQCGSHDVEQLRADGTRWRPGDASNVKPAPSRNGSTAGHVVDDRSDRA